METDKDNATARPSFPTSFYVHQWLDVHDEAKGWKEAQVIELDPPQTMGPPRRIQIHYKGWKKKFDEWIDLSDSNQVKRLASLHQHTPKPRQINYVQGLKPGAVIDALDTSDKWYTAMAIEMGVLAPPPGGPLMVKIHYDGWSAKFDEWVQADSYRLAPAGTFVIRSLEQQALLKQHTQTQAYKRAAPSSAASTTGESRRKYGAGAGTGDTVMRTGGSDEMNTSTGGGGTPSEEARFREQLRPLGWVIAEQAGDGNCLFRSVAHQLYGDPELHMLVRTKCMDYIHVEREYFTAFIDGDFDEYERTMRRGGTWGDHAEIQAISELYDRPVEVYAFSLTPITTFQGAHHPHHQQPIRLSYHYRSHYNSIIHPPSHREVLLRTRPGELEDAQIRQSLDLRQQPLTGQGTSGDIGDEEPNLQLALQLSRGQFGIHGSMMTNFDEAVHQTLAAAAEAASGGRNVTTNTSSLGLVGRPIGIASGGGTGSGDNVENEGMEEHRGPAGAALPIAAAAAGLDANAARANGMPVAAAGMLDENGQPRVPLAELPPAAIVAAADANVGHAANAAQAAAAHAAQAAGHVPAQPGAHAAHAGPPIAANGNTGIVPPHLRQRIQAYQTAQPTSSIRDQRQQLVRREQMRGNGGDGEDLQAALAQSLVETQGPATGDDLALALERSLLDTASPSRNQTDQDLEEALRVSALLAEKPKQSDSMMVTNSNDREERVVAHCNRELGFPLEMVRHAYTIMGQDTKVSEDILIQNMTNYLLSQGL